MHVEWANWVRFLVSESRPGAPGTRPRQGSWFPTHDAMKLRHEWGTQAQDDTRCFLAKFRDSFRGRFFFEVFEGGEGFFGDVPLAEDFVDDGGGEAGGYEAAHDAGCFFFICGFADALAFQVLAGEDFFVSIGVAGFDGVGDDLARDAFLSEVLADAALAELFILLAKTGVDLGVGCVVEVAVFLEAGDGGVDDGIAAIAGLYAHAHQAAKFSLGAHVAAERLYGVVVEAGFVEVRFGFHGSAMSVAVTEAAHQPE